MTKYCVVHGCQEHVYARGLCRDCYEHLKKLELLPPTGTRGRDSIIDEWPTWACALPVSSDRSAEFTVAKKWMEELHPPPDPQLPAQPPVRGSAGHVLLPPVRITPLKSQSPDVEEEDELGAIEEAWRRALGDLNPNDKPTVLSCVSMRVVQHMDEAGLMELAALALALLPNTQEDE